MSDLLGAMVGRWILCGSESVFGVGGGDVGLDITADNHWYRLFPAQGGGTVRGAGGGQDGTWTAIDLGDHFQVNFDTGSGTVLTAPVFAATPRGMRLNNNAVYVGNYVIDSDVPVGSVRCTPRVGSYRDAGMAADSGAIAPVCDAPTTSAVCPRNPAATVAVQSMSDLVDAMVGRWLSCGGASVFAGGGGDVGLEITADNHWYKLFPALGGGTVRGAGWDQEGTWTAIDLGDHFQVNLEIFGSGTILTAPVFAATPREMHLDNEGVYAATYVIDSSVPTGSVRCTPR